MSKIKPNIVRGGRAIDLGNNLFYMSGKKHSQGGIDIGQDAKTGLEVEGGEVVQITPQSLKVFSAQPILNGISPAQYILGGANPNQVFNAQEYWKQVNRVNDDGTQARLGTKRDKKNFKTILSKRQEKEFQNWYKNVSSQLKLNENPDNPLHSYDFRGYWLENRNKDIDFSIPDFHFPDKYKTPSHETFSRESIYADKEYGIDPKTVGYWDGETFKPGDFNTILQASLAYKSPLQEKYKQKTGQYVYNTEPYTPSQEIINYIKDVEKFSPTWYKDGKGIDTIGYGFTGSDIKKQFPNGISKEEADRVFADSLVVRAKILQRDTPNWESLNQNQRDALLSYHYNIGEGAYRDKNPNLMKALEKGDWETATQNIDFGYNDKKNSGLRIRRDYERNLFNTPVEYKYGGRAKKVIGGDEDDINFVGPPQPKYYDTIEPAAVTAKLPAKFNGSQAAAKRYAEGYQFGKKVNQGREDWLRNEGATIAGLSFGIPALGIGLTTAPLATIGSVIGGKIGEKQGRKINEEYGPLVGSLVGGAVGGGIGTSIKPLVQGAIRYGNNVLDRTAEAIVRIGDNADLLPYLKKQLTDKNTLKYIFNNKASDLAYKMPFKYSGNGIPDAFPGDVVDQFFGKSPVPDATYNYSVLSKGMQNYISKYYPNKKIPIRDLGKVQSLLNTLNSSIKRLKVGESMKADADEFTLFDSKHIKPLLDPGGYNAVVTRTSPTNYTIKGTDIWKFNPEDYTSRYSARTPQDILRKLGLKFIDSRGTPIVHTFYSDEIIPKSYKYGGIHIKKSKRGTFTAEAKRRGISVQELAARILANKSKYSSAMIKKAVFARNARKWKHKEFGGEMTNNYYITPNNIYKLGGQKKAVYGIRTIVPDNLPYGLLPNMSIDQGLYKDNHKVGIDSSLYGVDYRSPDGSSKIFNDWLNLGEAVLPPTSFKTSFDGNYVYNSPLSSTLMNRNLLMSLAKLRGGNGVPIDNNGGNPTNLQPVTNSSPTFTPNSSTTKSTVVSIPQLDSSRIAADVASQTEAQAQRDLNSIIRNGNDYINLSTLGQLNLPTRLTTPSSTLVDTRTPKSLTNAQRLGLRISNGLRTGLNAVGNFIRENPLDVAETAINLGGNLAASLINRRAIRDLKSPSAPLPLRANKLKTRININPQLDEIRETVASYEDDVTRNTASSKTALANRQNIRARGMQYANQLRGQKENIETSLINEDRMNQQNVGNQNVQLVNNWLRDVTELKNNKRLMQAENSVAGINNAADALSGFIGAARTNRQIEMQRDRDILSAAIMAIANPNAQKVLGDTNIINSIMDNIRNNLYNLPTRKKVKNNNG